jgi:hypothetical protein
MNKRIRELAEQCETKEIGYYFFDREKFAMLIIREANQAVLDVPCYHTDYRSQIEEAVINDCARAVLERFGVQ